MDAALRLPPIEVYSAVIEYNTDRISDSRRTCRRPSPSRDTPNGGTISFFLNPRRVLSSIGRHGTCDNRGGARLVVAGRVRLEESFAAALPLRAHPACRPARGRRGVRLHPPRMG